MSDNKFDQHIKDQLDGFHLNYDKSSWDTFNSRLDQEFGTETTTTEDLSFDKNIADKLSNQEIPYNASHWSKLLRRLELEDSVRNRLISLTVMEITAVILILIALWNWKGAEYLNQQNQDPKIPVAAIESDINQTDSDIYQSSYPPLDKANQSYKENDKDIKNNQPSSSEIEPIKINSLSSVLESKDISKGIEKPLPSSTYAVINESSHTSDHMISDTRSVALNYKSTQNNTSDRSDISKNSSSFYIAGDNANVFSPAERVQTSVPSLNTRLDKRDILEASPQIDNDQYVLKVESPELLQRFVLIDILKPKKKLEISMAIVGSPDAYLIRSPDDPVYPYPSYYTDSKGLTGGVLFSAKSKSAEMETGILYSSVEYAPRQINENYSSLGKYYSTSLEDILFNVISVPFNFKLHLNVNPKRSFYMSFGSSFNAIINSNFNISTTEIADPLSPVADSNKNEPELNRKPQIPGALEGGSLLENTFITADLGIGYQQKISDRISLFVQPTIHTHFSAGIGPNKDKLHKLSLFAGAKYNLN